MIICFSSQLWSGRVYFKSVSIKIIDFNYQLKKFFANFVNQIVSLSNKLDLAINEANISLRLFRIPVKAKRKLIIIVIYVYIQCVR